MACTILEIIMFLGGIYLLFRPKLDLTDRIYLEGQRARIVGIMWIAPLPLAFILGVLVGVLIGLGAVPEDANWIVSCAETLLVIGVFIGSFVYARKTS